MKRFYTLSAIIAASLISHLSYAQVPSFGTPSGISGAFIRLFGPVSNFTARAEVKVLNSDGQEFAALPMQAAALDGKLRLELSLESIRSKQLPPAAIDGLKQAGLGTMVTLILPDKNSSVLIYPGAKSYVNVPSEESGTAPQFKIETSELGKEKVGEQSTTRNKVIVMAAGARVIEATTWNATGLKGFPVKIETREKDKTTVMTFSDVRLQKPEAALFAVPVGFKEYTDPQELMMSVMQRMMAQPEAGPK